MHHAPRRGSARGQSTAASDAALAWIALYRTDWSLRLWTQPPAADDELRGVAIHGQIQTAIDRGTKMTAMTGRFHGQLGHKTCRLRTGRPISDRISSTDLHVRSLPCDHGRPFPFGGL